MYRLLSSLLAAHVVCACGVKNPPILYTPVITKAPTRDVLSTMPVILRDLWPVYLSPLLGVAYHSFHAEAVAMRVIASFGGCGAPGYKRG